MFRNQSLAMPKKKSLLFTLIVASSVFFGAQASPIVGYFVALLGLVVIVLASFLESFWPTKAKAENAVAFSLFWGIMIGVLLPFVLTTFLEGGLRGVYEIFASPV